MLKKKIIYLLLLFVLSLSFACSSDTVTPQQEEQQEQQEEEQEETEEEENETEELEGVIPDPGDTSSKDKPTFNVDPRPNGTNWMFLDAISDEFNVDGLDSDKWEDGPHSKFPWAGQDPSAFVTETTTVEGGELRIEHIIFEEERTIKDKTRLYGGGIIRSKATADVGTYYEARVRAGHSPFSTAFWVINRRAEKEGCKRTTELDVLECIGRRSREYTGNYGFQTNWVGQMHSNTLSRETSCPETYPNNTNQQFTKELETGNEN